MFAHNVKTGDYGGETKNDIKTPEETLTTSPAMIVDKKVNMQEIVNSPCRQISKRIHTHSEI